MEEIEFKDINFGITNLGQITADVGRDHWSISNLNDMSSDTENHLFKPRSLATQYNDLDSDYNRYLNFKASYDGEYAGNLTIREYDEYMFIFDMELEPEYRGKGGGKLFMDLFKASIIFSGKDLAGGFVGNGNTKEFLKHNGFSRAEFETWTNNIWASHMVSGEFVTEGDYYSIAENDRFGLVPTPTDIKSKYKEYVLEPTERGTPWTRDEERRIETEGPDGISDEGKVLYPSRVRQEIAMPFWEGNWSTWFKIPTRKIQFEDSIFPITDRETPVLDRFRDPTFEFIR